MSFEYLNCVDFQYARRYDTSMPIEVLRAWQSLISIRESEGSELLNGVVSFGL